MIRSFSIDSIRTLFRIFEHSLPTLFAASFLLPAELWGQNEPKGLLLTWHGDPTSTMVIDWHVSSTGEADSAIHYRKTSDSLWLAVEGRSIAIPFLGKTIYRKELTELVPGTRYAFRLGNGNQEYYFETMPRNLGHEPIVFAIGGNTLDQEIREGKVCMERMTDLVARFNPRFLLWSGQWPDARAEKDIIWKWHEWFDAFQNGLINSEGLVIPVVIPVGNSNPPGSVESGFNGMKPDHIIQDHGGYRAWDFGEYLSILHMDPQLLEGKSGKQAKSLKKALRKRKNRPHVFPVYQAQAFPAIHENTTGITQNLKKYWTPFFDRYRIPMVFEFQENRYKRSFPLRNDKIKPGGTIYIGHGGWNTSQLPPQQANLAWYIDQKIRERTIILIALHGNNRYIRVVNEFGQTVDEYPRLFARPNFTNTFSTLLPKGGITLSAELAKTYGKVHVEAMPSAALGDGFARFDQGGEPAGLIWRVPSHTTNDYSIRFRYSHTGEEDAQLQLLINGDLVAENFIFRDLGSENRWQRSSLINVVLKKGPNRVEIRTHPKRPAPRIDRIEIFPAVF